METNQKANQETSLFSIATEIECVNATAARIRGMISLLTDAIERDVKTYPYSQNYVDMLYACLDYAQDVESYTDTISKALYAVHFATKKTKEAAA